MLTAKCANTSTVPPDAGAPDSGTVPTDAGAADAGTTSDAGSPILTVKNYLSWCSVSVNGGSTSVAAVQTVSVTPGTIPLSATASSATFALGPWHHTAGDTGAGDPGTVSGGTSTASVVVGNTAACVWICCPFANGTGCPATDQCP
jgi:hypothetical protein